MRIQIVCRGSVEDGLGHLFRVRTFAEVALRSHEVCVIAVVEHGLESVFEKLACQVHFLRYDELVVDYVCAYMPDVLVFDLTRLDENVFLQVNKLSSITVSLSPVFEHMALVDVAFTRSIVSLPIAGLVTFSGLEYAIFSDDCVRISDKTYERVLSLGELPIAVCMGGSDAANKTLHVLKALIRLETKNTIWVHLGEGYVHRYDDLVDCVRGSRHEVILARTNRSMWRIMSNCALAILAGGLTTIEAVYAGLPTINLFRNREQVETMPKELFDLGVCVDGGVFSDECLETLTDTVKRFNVNRKELRTMRERSKHLVDTRGSERVLHRLEEVLANQL